MFFVFVRLTVDRNLPLILHPALFNERVAGLAGYELPVVLPGGGEAGDAGGDVAVKTGLNTAHCHLSIKL